MIASASFPGWGLLYEPGFSTDISETCSWISVFHKEPDDPQDLRYKVPTDSMDDILKTLSFSRTIVKSVSNGANNGLRLLLDAEAFDYTFSLGPTEGFTISILHQV
jgi:hypothetical protein